MADAGHSHQHPDYNKRIKTLEELIKKLENRL